MSQTMEESKERGVFICEYTTPQNPFRINDSIQLHLKDCWLEKHWEHRKDSEKGTRVIAGYSLIMEVAEEDILGYNKGWTISDDSVVRYFRKCGIECLMTDFDSLPQSREIWSVRSGKARLEIAKNPIIGELILIKKD